MKLRTTVLSLLFLFLAGAALAVPTADESPAPSAATLAATDVEFAAAPTGYAIVSTVPTQTAVWRPWPCDDLPFPPWPRPYPTIFPLPLPGPTDHCFPSPFPF